MSKPSHEILKLKAQFERSWLASEKLMTKGSLRKWKPADILDYAVTCRQTSLRKAKLGDDAHDSAATFTVLKIVQALRRTVLQLVDGSPFREVVDVTLWATLLAELCASALCPNEKKAGQIYPKPDGMDDGWARVHRPLYLLRNVILHPGAVLPHKKLEAEGHVSHLGAMMRWMKVNPETNLDGRALRELELAPSNVQGDVFARWAFEKVDLMGDWELDRMGATRDTTETAHSGVR